MFAVKNLYLDDIAMLSHTSYRTMLGTDLAVPIDVPEGKKKQWKVVTQEGGWADNMSQVDFGSWITNDFEKRITLNVAIPSANRAGRTAANVPWESKLRSGSW